MPTFYQISLFHLNLFKLHHYCKFIASHVRLLIIAYSTGKLFQTADFNNSFENNQLKSAQIISVNTNMNITLQNNSLVNLIFTQFEVFVVLTQQQLVVLIKLFLKEKKYHVLLKFINQLNRVYFGTMEA